MSWWVPSRVPCGPKQLGGWGRVLAAAFNGLVRQQKQSMKCCVRTTSPRSKKRWPLTVSTDTCGYVVTLYRARGEGWIAERKKDETEADFKVRYRRESNISSEEGLSWPGCALWGMALGDDPAGVPSAVVLVEARETGNMSGKIEVGKSARKLAELCAMVWEGKV